MQNHGFPFAHWLVACTTFSWKYGAVGNETHQAFFHKLFSQGLGILGCCNMFAKSIMVDGSKGLFHDRRKFNTQHGISDTGVDLSSTCRQTYEETYLNTFGGEHDCTSIQNDLCRPVEGDEA
jgi:hypothetical protein